MSVECITKLLALDTIPRSRSFGHRKSPFDSFYSLQPTVQRVDAYIRQFLKYLDIADEVIVYGITLLSRYINCVELQITGKNW